MSDRDSCPACGIPYDQHPGLIPTCDQVQALKHRITVARQALLKIWDRGESCEHVHARQAFSALNLDNP